MFNPAYQPADERSSRPVSPLSDFDSVVFAAPAELTSALYEAIDQDDESEVFRLAELILAKGHVMEQQRDPSGRGLNPLHYAVVGSRATSVRALCQLGVSVEATTPMGRNAVHLAVQHRSKVALSILADFGGQAAFLARDARGATPLDLAHADDEEILRYVQLSPPALSH